MLTNRQLFLQNLAQTSDSPIGLEIERAEGIYLYSTTGKRYADLISGISVSNTGHRHPKVIAAIKEQLDHYLHLMVYGEYIQAPQVKLASRLAGLLPASLSSTYLVNSGSEAVEGALKLAKRFTGRREIISFYGAYHGGTHGSLSIMGDERLKKPFYPLLPEVRHLTINSPEDLNLITEHTACVIIEPVQGEAGVIKANQEFLKALKDRCVKCGALLIFDEIQTGFGRTGSLFAFEQLGVIPDILLLAKGMGGGLPIGAFISSEKIMASLSHDPALGHITTFGGNPVCCAAALANLEVILEEDLLSFVSSKESLFRESLEGLKGVMEYRSAGLLIAVEMENFQKVKGVIDYCLEQGVIVDWFLFNDRSIRIAPPLTITLEEIRESCIILKDAFNRAE
ncbi:MAG: aspartate aminotransferase family protein [Bacteroidales bacterium]|nr:aspartate aminotransferase family protein [Bacteroidales bacterium]